jgi:hypothetical protein
MQSKLSFVSLSIGALLMLSFLSMANVYADHHAAARDKNFQEYCLNYQYTGQAPNSLNVQCEETKKACDERYAEYAAREDLQPTSDCYKADVGRLATVYCIDYYTPGNGASGASCVPSTEQCAELLAQYEARNELDPSDPDYLEITNPDTCYKHEKEYVNFSEHPYLRQYQ